MIPIPAKEAAARISSHVYSANASCTGRSPGSSAMPGVPTAGTVLNLPAVNGPASCKNDTQPTCGQLTAAKGLFVCTPLPSAHSRRNLTQIAKLLPDPAACMSQCSGMLKPAQAYVSEVKEVYVSREQRAMIAAVFSTCDLGRRLLEEDPGQQLVCAANSGLHSSWCIICVCGTQLSGREPPNANCPPDKAGNAICPQVAAKNGHRRHRPCLLLLLQRQACPLQFAQVVRAAHGGGHVCHGCPQEQGPPPVLLVQRRPQGVTELVCTEGGVHLQAGNCGI